MKDMKDKKKKPAPKGKLMSLWSMAKGANC